MLAAPLREILKKTEKFEWSPRQQEAFENIKTVLTTAPILACPDFSHPFTLSADASKIGIGAILKLRLHDASNTSNVGYWKHSTHRVAEAQMTNDKRPASNVGVGR